MHRSAAAAAFALVALLLCTAAHAAPRIGLVTMQPGEVYWSRFGHNAILVQQPSATGGAPRSTLYNYGYFDFAEPGFLLRFLQGKMQYQLAALPAAQDLASYRAEGRGAILQWLAFDADEADALARFLEWNARPENARYRYDYFTDNCSTKVRDALDRALGGTLRPRLQARSRGLSYRWESLRLGAPEPWLFLGMHAGLGPWADRPLSRWDESFVPMRLAEALREVQRPDGRPLVASEQVLLPHLLEAPFDARPVTLWAFAAAGTLLALLLVAGLRARHATPRRFAAGLAAGVWLLAGLGGWLLAGLWAFTDHQAAWRNENLLLFNPLALLLLGALPELWRGEAGGQWLRWLARVVLVSALVAAFLKFLPWRVQDNLDWIVFWIPVHAALAWRLSHRGPTGRGALAPGRAFPEHGARAAQRP